MDEKMVQEIADRMKAIGHQYWLMGPAHCMACGYEMHLIAPYPVALDPNGECRKCGAYLVVYNSAEEMKAQCAADKRLPNP